MELSESERDATAELFNLGMGQAADALSQMVGQEVRLAIPRLNLDTRSRTAGQITGLAAGRLCTITEAFSGPFTGEAMLVFPESACLDLLRHILPGVRDAMTEAEEEALTEIGNIILNGCLASFADLMGTEIHSGLPHYRAGLPACLIDGGCEDHVLMTRIDFGLADGSANGYALFLMEIEAVQAFRQALRRLLASLGL